MERKKPKSSGSTDELALVKAAAWAWYQHGSGSEGKPMRELDVTRTHQAPRPSRYKLEAMRLMMEDTMEGSETSSPSQTDNSLLDTYEIESISKQLDYLIESSSKRFYGKFFDKDPHHHQKNLSSWDSDNSTTSPMKHKKKKKFFKGFWPKHAVVCGTKEDVDTRAFVHNRPKSQKVMFR